MVLLDDLVEFTVEIDTNGAAVLVDLEMVRVAEDVHLGALVSQDDESVGINVVVVDGVAVAVHDKVPGTGRLLVHGPVSAELVYNTVGGESEVAGGLLDKLGEPLLHLLGHLCVRMAKLFQIESGGGVSSTACIVNFVSFTVDAAELSGVNASQVHANALLLSGGAEVRFLCAPEVNLSKHLLFNYNKLLFLESFNLCSSSHGVLGFWEIGRAHV